ncbi:MAG: nucleotide exchange factor GrpE [Gammaproteobacteria bacterium]|nr:nucleotide exchange factor GrpE [Gammaproteobacteria bacterium]
MTDMKEEMANPEAEVDEQEAVSPQGEDTLASLKEALAAAEAKAQENWDLALRTKAEAENIKRRAEKDVSNAHRYALEKFVNELVPVIDSMELGLAVFQGNEVDATKIREGSELTLKMLASAVEKFGVEQMNPQGEKFNPEFHQAMTMQESTEQEPNTVLTVIQKGYTLHGRLVRPAMVVVSKAANPPQTGGNIDEQA